MVRGGPATIAAVKSTASILLRRYAHPVALGLVVCELTLRGVLALGIVADVATLRDDVRYLLQLGLDVLRDGERLGLKAMMALAPQSRATRSHSPPSRSRRSM